MSLTVPKNERGMIRVFAINRPPLEMAAVFDKRPKPDVARELLSAPHINTSSTEIFPMSDLAGVGLCAYLTEGYAVEETSLAPDRQKLDALDGYVMLVFSDSFGETETTLDPGPDVTLIGTYAEARADMSVRPIPTDAAAPYSGVPPMPEPQPKSQSGSLIVVIAVFVLALALWWMFS